MLVLIVLFVFLNLSLLAVLSFVLSKYININKIFPGETIARDLGFNPKVPPLDQVSRFLDDDLEKTLVSQVCEQGGYNIDEFVDSKLFINSFGIKEVYQEGNENSPRHPLKFIWLEPVDGAVIQPFMCAYIGIDFDRDDDPLIPGIFSVKDKQIVK